MIQVSKYLEMEHFICLRKKSLINLFSNHFNFNLRMNFGHALDTKILFRNSEISNLRRIAQILEIGILNN